MKLNRRNLSLTILIVFLFCLNIFSQDCGKERWHIKTLSDADTLFVNFDTIRLSSIPEQINMPKPEGKPEARLASETSLYTIECYIVGFAEEKDRDIHIVIADINTDVTMVAEIVSPECSDVQTTSRYLLFKYIYDWFSDHIGIPKHSFIILDECKFVTITGIGFWDHIHGQKGMAGNGREIHPVLFIFENTPHIRE